MARRKLTSPLIMVPHSSVGKESACNAGDPGLIPGSGRSPGEGIGYPPTFLGFPCGSAGKETAGNAGDLGSNPAGAYLEPSTRASQPRSRIPALCTHTLSPQRAPQIPAHEPGVPHSAHPLVAPRIPRLERSPGEG